MLSRILSERGNMYKIARFVFNRIYVVLIGGHPLLPDTKRPHSWFVQAAF